MRSFRPASLALALAGLAGAPPVLADGVAFFFPGTPYLSEADIPAGFYAGGLPAFLENFEDGSLGGNLVASVGAVVVPGQFDGLRDGVDGDDGVIDGTCGPQGARCSDWFSGNGPAGVTFSYGGTTLPTAFGVVWTDGGGPVSFSAFDGNGQLLGTFTPAPFGDPSSSGGTAEDRFFGATYAGGIGAIKISNGGGGIEIDHVQYGTRVSAVPEPPAWALLAAGGLLALSRARRRVR